MEADSIALPRAISLVEIPIQPRPAYRYKGNKCCCCLEKWPNVKPIESVCHNFLYRAGFGPRNKKGYRILLSITVASTKMCSVYFVFLETRQFLGSCGGCTHHCLTGYVKWYSAAQTGCTERNCPMSCVYIMKLMTCFAYAV